VVENASARRWRRVSLALLLCVLALAIAAPSAFGGNAYVANSLSDSVSVFSTATNQILSPPISIDENPATIDEPVAIAITPDGKTAYVVNTGSDSVSTIDTQTNQVVGMPIAVGDVPGGIAITPDGKTAYVASRISGNVSVIDTRTNQVVGTPIVTGPVSGAVTSAPNGETAFVAGGDVEGRVSVVDTKTNQLLGAPIAVGRLPRSIAVVPDQPPLASFSVPGRARPGVPLQIDASASRDADGSIATYAWDFGDRQSATATSPSQTHTFGAPGTYRVTLSLTDDEGCSGALVFTGQTPTATARPWRARPRW
jgi:YVTN family beta-propeller protein